MGINTTYYQNQPVSNGCLPRHPLNFAAKSDCAGQLLCASNRVIVLLLFVSACSIEVCLGGRDRCKVNIQG